MNKSEMLRIDDDVPVPPRHSNKRSEYRPILSQLKVGQSVVIPEPSRSRVSNLAGRVLGAGNYSCRAEGYGIRVWRVK